MERVGCCTVTAFLCCVLTSNTRTHAHTFATHRLAYSKQGAACQGYGVDMTEEGPAGGGASSAAGATASQGGALAAATAAAGAAALLALLL